MLIIKTNLYNNIIQTVIQTSPRIISVLKMFNIDIKRIIKTNLKHMLQQVNKDLIKILIRQFHKPIHNL